MEHVKFKVSRTAHTYTLGNNIDNAKYIWFVFHGYGQLASNIIKKFDKLDMDDHFVIGLEGLSRFYWGGVTGKVVASWMTSGDRLDEIDDYLTFIDQVYNHFNIVDKKGVFRCLAFSQGCATCWRWMGHRRPPLDAFVQWAGTFPPELDYAGEFNDYATSFKHIFTYGDEDIYLTPERMEKFKLKFESYNLNFEIRKFEGKHKIYRGVLYPLIESLG